MSKQTQRILEVTEMRQHHHQNLSYSQKKRAKLNYRKVYFQHNPDLFGCLWFCVYCHKIIIGKENVEVDRVIPLNSRLGKE